MPLKLSSSLRRCIVSIYLKLAMAEKGSRQLMLQKGQNGSPGSPFLAHFSQFFNPIMQCSRCVLAKRNAMAS